LGEMCLDFMRAGKFSDRNRFALFRLAARGMRDYESDTDSTGNSVENSSGTSSVKSASEESLAM
jgi:hypothetical protein